MTDDHRGEEHYDRLMAMRAEHDRQEGLIEFPHARKFATPLLDELERGPWPSFVKGII
jgi:hypothetical protein